MFVSEDWYTAHMTTAFLSPPEVCGLGPLDGHVILVTGSSSGIGAALARLLTENGATVVVNSARSVEAGNALAESLPRADYVQADIADAAQVRCMVETVLQRHRRLDAVVNNAGTTQVIPHADLGAANPEVWNHIFNVNVVGTWQVTVAAVPYLRESGHGQIMNITSMAGSRPTGSSIPYACSKAAVNHMTRLLASTLGPDIRVNAVAPGLVDTPWTKDWDNVRAYVRDHSPLQRSATAEDVAQAAFGLMISTHVTGAILPVDGGMSLR